MRTKLRFACAFADPVPDDDGYWFDMEAASAEDAARAFVEYMDGRDPDAFQRPDDVTEVLVRVANIETRFGVTFDYVKSWRIRMLTRT